MIREEDIRTTGRPAPICPVCGRRAWSVPDQKYLLICEGGKEGTSVSPLYCTGCGLILLMLAEKEAPKC